MERVTLKMKDYSKEQCLKEVFFDGERAEKGVGRKEVRFGRESCTESTICRSVDRKGDKI